MPLKIEITEAIFSLKRPNNLYCENCGVSGNVNSDSLGASNWQVILLRHSCVFSG